MTEDNLPEPEKVQDIEDPETREDENYAKTYTYTRTVTEKFPLSRRATAFLLYLLSRSPLPARGFDIYLTILDRPGLSSLLDELRPDFVKITEIRHLSPALFVIRATEDALDLLEEADYIKVIRNSFAGISEIKMNSRASGILQAEFPIINAKAILPAPLPSPLFATGRSSDQ